MQSVCFFTNQEVALCFKDIVSSNINRLIGSDFALVKDGEINDKLYYVVIQSKNSLCYFKDHSFLGSMFPCENLSDVTLDDFKEVAVEFNVHSIIDIQSIVFYNIIMFAKKELNLEFYKPNRDFDFMSSGMRYCMMINVEFKDRFSIVLSDKYSGLNYNSNSLINFSLKKKQIKKYLRDDLDIYHVSEEGKAFQIYHPNGVLRLMKVNDFANRVLNAIRTYFALNDLKLYEECDNQMWIVYKLIISQYLL